MSDSIKVNVLRKRGDTYAERFRFRHDVTGATFSLTVEGLGSLTGSIYSASSSESFVDFEVSEVTVYNGTAGTYDYGIIMTSSGTTRTAVEGTWTIAVRTFA
jgi:hypothetical protein